jgi:hypothetical protein
MELSFCCEYKKKLDKVADDFETIAKNLLISLEDGWMDRDGFEDQKHAARNFGNYLAHRVKLLSDLSNAITATQLKKMNNGNNN